MICTPKTVQIIEGPFFIVCDFFKKVKSKSPTNPLLKTTSLGTYIDNKIKSKIVEVNGWHVF
mgnify:CR=1 FL=1